MTEAIESSIISNEMYCFEISKSGPLSQSLCFVGGLSYGEQVDIINLENTVEKSKRERLASITKRSKPLSDWLIFILMQVHNSDWLIKMLADGAAES